MAAGVIGRRTIATFQDLGVNKRREADVVAGDHRGIEVVVVVGVGVSGGWWRWRVFDAIAQVSSVDEYDYEEEDDQSKYDVVCNVSLLIGAGVGWFAGMHCGTGN
ncbi:hypothetical protein R6Q57_005028 [Mikania cordata]